ncbi:MAG: ysnA, partial [bacterium]
LPSLADDSALEVDALGGAPGVQSARYAGPEAIPVNNIRKLLAALDGVEDRDRTARFRCVLALALPGVPEPEYFEGVVEGIIAREPVGGGGFGYDPVFVVTEVGRTMAELTSSEKGRLSHRARALAALRRRLRPLNAGRARP